jgi:EAL domain-containing protein (putative c-di-GMP-specific phosphodiesterase class I)
VDQSFITDIATNEDNLAFTKAIIAMAKTFGMEVVAEGVETDSQHSILMALGCDQFQGYLFSKPVQPKELTRLIKS